MNILEVKNLSKIYGKGDTLVKAVDDVSFTVEQGEFVAIIGPSGSGKSTLLHIIGGVDTPTTGNVIIDGPLDVRTSCEQASGSIKGIVSPIDGQADVLIFPNIESGNTFYKSVSLFANADMAGLLQGPVCPVVLPSRSDSGLSKYYSMAMACLTCK